MNVSVTTIPSPKTQQNTILNPAIYKILTLNDKPKLSYDKILNISLNLTQTLSINFTLTLTLIIVLAKTS
jgi:hypothetical protein